MQHANQLLSSDGKLYAQSLLHAEASPQLRARCVREQPIYAKPDTPQELLNNVLHQVAQCRALSVDLEGDKPNPLALAAFRACKPYWLAHKHLDYEVAVKVATTHYTHTSHMHRERAHAASILCTLLRPPLP